ncbi:hypothetical protein EQH57_0385 [Dictyocoela roeselum]|nr:hypothetical protein EQH57_0385 [Dictyocoela roeselum]
MHENFETPKSTASQIFIDTKSAFKYLIEEELIPREVKCESCYGQLKIITDASYALGGCFRCSDTKCRKRFSIFKGKNINIPAIPLHSKLLAIYEFLNDDFQKRIANDCDIARSTVYSLRKNINVYIEQKIKPLKNIMLGGSYNVQIDETVIYKGKMITNPTNMWDETPGCTWLVGLIEQYSGKIIIEIVPNRQIPTISKLIQKHVLIGTLIITDGHPSYPRSVKDSFCNHEVVNHSKEFSNKNGFHTNNIENLWSQLKYYDKKRLGVKKCYIMFFLNEFIFRYYFLKRGEYKEIGGVWYEILCWLINN